MNIDEILKYLPHRYPFLLLDRVLELKEHDYVIGQKNVTINEPFFQGHFPENPVMPGVLILEALAQAAGVLAYRSEEHEPDREANYLFVGIDNARFRRVVKPGDVLKLRAKKIREMRGIWKFEAEATVDGELAAAATLLCSVRR